jgi:hypothetical protein
MRTIAFVLAATALLALAIRMISPDGSAVIDPLQAQRLEVVPAADSAIASSASIEELYELEHAHRPASQFWHLDTQAQAKRIEHILAAERNARAALVARFGLQVSQLPIFWRLFRPLHERMPQLTSSQQITIHELERQFAANSLEPYAKTSFEQHLERVRDHIGATLANEYALRSSPVAAELRRVGVELSEEDFRAAFAALNELSEATDHGQFIAARGRLRERLGSRHFARLWSLRDPRFSRIESTAQRFGLTDETTLTAYANLLENQEAMLAAVTPSDPIAQQDAMRQQYDDGRRRLRDLVGARAADALLQAAAGAPESNAEQTH